MELARRGVGDALLVLGQVVDQGSLAAEDRHLEIAEDQGASAALAAVPFEVPPNAEELRKQLLACCERDTLATVYLVRALRSMSAGQEAA